MGASGVRGLAGARGVGPRGGRREPAAGVRMSGAWWELVAPTRPVGARVWSPMQPAEACGRLGMNIAEPATDLHGEEEDKEERLGVKKK